MCKVHASCVSCATGSSASALSCVVQRQGHGPDSAETVELLLGINDRRFGPASGAVLGADRGDPAGYQFLDKVIDVSVAVHVWLLTCTLLCTSGRGKLWNFRSCSSSWVRGSSWARLLTCPSCATTGAGVPVEIPQVQFLNKVDMPVVVQRQVPGSSCPRGQLRFFKVVHRQWTCVNVPKVALSFVRDFFKSRRGGGSDDCARGGDTSSSRSLRPWPRTRTTAHSARRRPGPGSGSARDALYGDDQGPLPPPHPHSPAVALRVVVRRRAWRCAARVGHGPCAAEAGPVEHRVEACASVQILDAPVPQGENQLVEAFRHLDLSIPEQVVAVPKISSSSRRSRRMLRAPQTAEQLVEVPTIASSSLQQQTAEQIIDIPVPGRGGGGGRGGLQGFPSGQNSTRTEFNSVLWSRAR